LDRVLSKIDVLQTIVLILKPNLYILIFDLRD
jgi:hypothetical protein